MQALKAPLQSNRRFLLRMGFVLPCTLMLAASACGPSEEGAETPALAAHALTSDTPPACASAPPTLTLNGSAEMTFECGPGTYSDPGAQAFDGCGQPMAVQAYNTGNDSSGPGPLLGFEGSYYISYNTWNNQGAASATRIVTVADQTPPTLTLTGPAFVTHTCNTPWVDPGTVATDTCYASVSDAVVRTGEVNAWAEGTYTVTYSVTDAAGNSAPPVTRTVEVVDCPW